MSKKQEIYRAYIERDDKTSVQDIAASFNVDRRYVHQVIIEISKGEGKKKSLKERMKICREDQEKKCLWECWFKEWFEAIKEFNQGGRLEEEFTYFVQTMANNKFNASEIARYTGKDHSTIRHHLSKVNHVKKTK